MNLISSLFLALVASDPGTAVLPVAKIGQGPRAAAMGECFTGLADDASAVYWNPAGLGQLSQYQLALSHQQWFAGIRDEVLHAALPLGPGSAGFGLVYSGTPDVQYWDDATATFKSYGASSIMLSAGYGVRLHPKARLGAALNGTYEDLLTEKSIGGAASAGLHAQPVSWLGLGLAARHLGAVSVSGAAEPLPMELAAGAVCGNRVLRGTLDATLPFLDNPPSYRAGIEFAPLPIVALRCGYRTGPVALKDLGAVNGLTAGLGVTVGTFGIDYAFVPYGELGATHRLGLRLGNPAPTLGGLTVVVLDRETRARLSANLAVTGVLDTTAIADELTASHLRPGPVEVRASADAYEPQSVALKVVAGRVTHDTILLPRMKASIKGGIYDAHTREPIGGTLDYSGPLAGVVPVAAMPGTFTIANLAQGDYVLHAAGPTQDYLPQTCTLHLRPGETAERNFYLWRKGAFLVLEGVNFETGKADILPQFLPILDRAGQILVQTLDIRKVELAGHTDPRDINTTEFPSNWELSQARADAVRRYLVAKFGIAPERLTTRGYADTQPVASNATPEGMWKNRRTELRILD
jgi:outer membrane protein OmpA-like peptidoglycan-associated protein